jgi:hypothetical protein
MAVKHVAEPKVHVLPKAGDGQKASDREKVLVAQKIEYLN